MIETLAIINGLEIYRHHNEVRCYWVAEVGRNPNWHRFQTFRTLKAAKAFCENFTGWTPLNRKFPRL